MQNSLNMVELNSLINPNGNKLYSVGIIEGHHSTVIRKFAKILGSFWRTSQISDSIAITPSGMYFGKFNSEAGRYSFGSSEVAKERDDSMQQLRKHRDASITNSTRLSQALSIIKNIQKECSKEGWDGYDAKPIAIESAQNAFNFIEKLDRCIPLPDFLPEPTGELVMEWEKNGYKLVMGIDNSDMIAYGETSTNGCNYGTYKFIYDIPINLKILITKYS